MKFLKDPNTITSKSFKNLRINLEKYVQVLYTEKYKLLREIKEDLNKWEDMPCLWIRSLNIIRMSIFSKIGLESQCNPNEKFTGVCLCVDKLILKIYMAIQRSKRSQDDLKEK